jgi:hypothetical protein
LLGALRVLLAVEPRVAVGAYRLDHVMRQVLTIDEDRLQVVKADE